MNKVRKPILWFDKTFQKKEDFQSVFFAAFIVLIIFTKCYTLLYPQAKAKQVMGSEIREQKRELTKISLVPNSIEYIK